MTYAPNLKDPRVQKRIRTAIGFVTSALDTTKPRPWSKTSLNKYLGHTHRDLGGYLRKRLIIPADTHYNHLTGKCKTYLLNEEGYRELINESSEFIKVFSTSNNLSVNKVEIAHDWATQEYGSSLESGVFEYDYKTHRHWHELQRMPNSLRNTVFLRHGYAWSYDIRCAAQSMILNLTREYAPHTRFTTLELHQSNPREFRQQFAQEIGCTPKQAKQLLTARLAGARLGLRNSLAHTLNHNLLQYQRLQNSEVFEAYTQDCKQAWNILRDNREIEDLQCKTKWRKYFQLESTVMNVVRTELDKRYVKYFLEHDGWRCDSWIDPQQLKKTIQRKLNWWIDFEYEQVVIDEKEYYSNSIVILS